MVAFPSDIRYFDATSFEEDHENPVLAGGELEGGYKATRPRFTRQPRRTFRWHYRAMRDPDVTTLRDFWRSHRGGSNMFQWTHPVSGEVINCRFHDQMRLNFKRTGVGPINLWDSNQIIIEEV